MKEPFGLEVPELGADEVHLWWGCADDLDAAGVASLSGQELERAERFVAPEHGLRFRARRAFLRRVLGAYTGRDPETLTFDLGAHGKPRLVEDELAFNLSRTEDLILIAVTRGREVGVDVEADRPITDVTRLARRILNPREDEAFRALDESERRTAFFRLWARKEAVLKVTGEGLSRDPRSLDLGLETHSIGELWRPADEPCLAGHALCDLVDAAEGPAACLCAEGDAWHAVVVRPRPGA